MGTGQDRNSNKNALMLYCLNKVSICFTELELEAGVSEHGHRIEPNTKVLRGQVVDEALGQSFSTCGLEPFNKSLSLKIPTLQFITIEKL